jgi:hypothetical protein
MKIVAYLLIFLLVATLGGAAYFYLTVHQPMALDLAKMKAGLPEFDRLKRDFRKCQDAEKAATGWTGPVADQLGKGLAAEIADGKAEVVVSGNRVVANIDETVLLPRTASSSLLPSPPRSRTFTTGKYPWEWRRLRFRRRARAGRGFLQKTLGPSLQDGR